MADEFADYAQKVAQNIAHETIMSLTRVYPETMLTAPGGLAMLLRGCIYYGLMAAMGEAGHEPASYTATAQLELPLGGH